MEADKGSHYLGRTDIYNVTCGGRICQQDDVRGTSGDFLLYADKKCGPNRASVGREILLQ